MADPAPPLRLSVVQLEERLDGFVTEYLKDKSEQTRGTYRRTLNEFERYHAARAGRPSSRFRFVEADVEAYKAYLMEERELSQVSVSTYLTAIRRFCDYLVARGDLAENPARGVKGNRRPESHSRAVLRADEVEALFEAVPEATLIGRRDRAIMALMVYGGLSEIELVRADVDDLDRTLMGTVIRVQGKGRTSKDARVPLDDSALGPLDVYLQARSAPPSAPLFVSHGHRSEGTRLNTRSVRGRINGHLRSAKLKRRGVSPHSLTHTAALIWLNDGMPVEEVRRRMRHGTLETTMISFRKQGLLTREPETE
ncbi:tyrosine-type recombinase/integrase [Rubrivirga litoralis]|uniref:Tyrosine-type recombinase/integrase n=1 Tax=Rubrivirga litoralis TaxID=3075598 RepID=A0ABU3BM53_9BACT|nr:tyrosine-type recombinase/integrase [Rubrivirga sp. F394]MDT0630369.1 tyrosine-type recombinase/integrase [Rubrivirga sp. F394]